MGVRETLSLFWNVCTLIIGVLVGVGIYSLIIIGSMCLASEKYDYLCGPAGRAGGITMVVIGCVLAVASCSMVVYTFCGNESCDICDDD